MERREIKKRLYQKFADCGFRNFHAFRIPAVFEHCIAKLKTKSNNFMNKSNETEKVPAVNAAWD
jgi:hypothetical protein